MAEQNKKPWPRDWIPMVCNWPATANRGVMRGGFLRVNCRDCGRELAASGETATMEVDGE